MILNFHSAVLGLVLLLVTAGVLAPLATVFAHDGEPSASPDVAAGNAFTYQGRLEQDGVPANGTYDFRFSLHGDSVADDPVGAPAVLTASGVTVTNGQFTARLDFGSAAFDGDARWLAIEVKQGADEFVSLGLRQELTATPYALFANAGPFWKLGGNSGTTSANFLGTTDNTALELRVNSLRGLRIEPGTTVSIIGGHPANSVQPGAVGATIGGGGADGAGKNQVHDNFGTIAGGQGNVAGKLDDSTTVSEGATVAGGFTNTAAGPYTTVAGGQGNSAFGLWATVGGGYTNSAANDETTIGGGRFHEASEVGATIAGGFNNTAAGQYAAIGGGYQNTASGTAYTTVAGGIQNTATGLSATVGGGSNNDATAPSAAIGGGNGNTASASSSTVSGGFLNSASSPEAAIGGGFGNLADGQGATIPGGRNNRASGLASFAAGQRAKALGNGTFVWADSKPFDYAISDADAFAVRATNGFEFVFQVNGSGTPTKYCHLNATSGSWACVSDRNEKTNFVDVDGRDVLAALESVPIQRWTFKDTEDPAPHMGPMAQDFFAAFALGGDDKSISTIDLDGVSLAAIKGLHEIAKEQEQRLAAVEARADLPGAVREDDATMAARLAALEARTSDGAPWLTFIAIGLACLGTGFGFGQRRLLRSAAGPSPASS